MNRDAILEVKHLSKSFGANAVLKDIDFVVHPGDVTSIIGSSGSGKSTLLRCINLLETPTSGDVVFHGDSVVDKKVNAAAYRAKVGMVFQSFNLFNNMSVLHRTDKSSEKKQRRSKRKGHAVSDKSRHEPVHQCEAASAFRRTETACGDRPCSGDGAGDPAL